MPHEQPAAGTAGLAGALFFLDEYLGGSINEGIKNGRFIMEIPCFTG